MVWYWSAGFTVQYSPGGGEGPPSAAESLGLACGLSVCISKELPDDADGLWMPL